MSPLDQAIAYAHRHPFVVDVVAAVPWCLLALLVQPFETLTEPQHVTWLAFAPLLGVGLALRRVRPLTSVLILAVLCVTHVLVLSGWTVAAAVATLSATHTAYARLTTRRRLAVTAAVLAGTVWASLDYSRDMVNLPPAQRWPVVGVTWMGLGIAALVGTLTRRRREEAEARERRQEQEVRLAALGERTHIAREMHDIVAHSLGVVVAQADGGRYAAATDPAAAARALETIGEVGRTSLAEMRDLLAVLRTDDPRDTLPTPSVGDLAALLADYRRAGLDVRVTTAGTPPPDLARTTALTVYRIVQESLTNALKHAGRTTVAVDVAWGADAIDVEARNPLPDPTGSPIDGHGLAGMRERVALHGGTFTAGPEGPVWLVRVLLPLRTERNT